MAAVTRSLRQGTTSTPAAALSYSELLKGKLFSIIVLVETAGRSLCEQHHTLTNKNMRSAAREVLIGRNPTDETS